MLNVLQIPASELFALLVAIGFAAGLNLYATVAVLGLARPFRSSSAAARTATGRRVAGYHRQSRALRGRILRRQDPRLRPDLERSPHLHPHSGRWIARLPRDQPALARAPVAGDTSGSRRRPDRARRQDRCSGCSDALSRPFSNITLSLGEDVVAIGLTWLATRHPYVAGTLATILIVIIGSARPTGIPSHARPVPRRGTGTRRLILGVSRVPSVASLSQDSRH